MLRACFKYLFTNNAVKGLGQIKLRKINEEKLHVKVGREHFIRKVFYLSYDIIRFLPYDYKTAFAES